MKNHLLALLAAFVMLGLLAGCASGPGKKQADKQEGTEKKAPALTEEQISKIVTQFAGISRKHAPKVWEANLKWEQATVEFEAYWLLRYKNSENNRALLSAAIKTHQEVKKLLASLCKLYPHNSPLNKMDEDATQGLNALLEARRRLAKAGAEKSP